MQNLKKIKGDASYRKFFRKKNKGITSIVVFAKKEKVKNLLIYDAINKILNKNKILTPNLIHENYKRNFIEIQDFGNETLFKILNKKKNKLFYFRKIIEILNKIQSVKDKKVINFIKKEYLMPRYEKKKINKEAKLICQW